MIGNKVADEMSPTAFGLEHPVELVARPSGLAEGGRQNRHLPEHILLANLHRSGEAIRRSQSPNLLSVKILRSARGAADVDLKVIWKQVCVKRDIQAVEHAFNKLSSTCCS